MVNVSRLSIDWFSEPMDMPWYGIDSAEPNSPEERFYKLIDNVVQQALDTSGLSIAEQQTMPVFLGSSSFEVGVSESRYRNALETSPDSAYPIQIQSIGHLLGHLRRHLGLQGPDFTYGTACAASANALLGAARMIEQGYAGHALAIGVELHNLTTLAGFHSLQLVAQDPIRPFDLNRGGMILGESCAAVVLSADSTDNSSIVFRGGASLCDTSSITSTNTDGKSIAEVIRQALADAKLAAVDVTLVKTHGTASLANDLAEATGLRQVFSSMPPVFALKPYTGHTLGACGVTEMILAAEAIRHRMIPSTPGFETLDPELGISPSAGQVSMPDSGACLLNYFGFGGNNSVLVLSYYNQ